MEIQFFGGNCVRLSTKSASIIVDDNLKELGLSTVTKPGEVALFTGPHEGEVAVDTKMVIDRAGEYEVSNVSIHGVPVRSHMDEAGKKTAVIYKLTVEDYRIAIVGHVHPDINEDQLETIGMVDILFVPVGGNGFTLDGPGALKVIRKIEPKLVIPTHYADPKVNYPVEQQDLETALKNMSIEPKETLDRLKLKPTDIGDTMQLIVLNRES